MTTALVVVGVFVLALTIAGLVCYRAFAVPAMRPLSPTDLALCAQIVRERKGIVWVCRNALQTGQCPCRPCAALTEARERAGLLSRAERGSF
jgi:hypothetical protein